MNKRVITVIVVAILAALCILAVVNAQGIMEFILQFHTIPQH